MTQKTQADPQAIAKREEMLLAKAQEIDQVASEAMAIYENATSFAHELQVAQSIRALREALTPEVMAPVMALMNTNLGFLTDRDPRKPKKNSEPIVPYSVDVVRDVFIEAKLRGFRATGNEFNIIAGNFYGAKNGLKRRCEQTPGVTDLKIWIDVPRTREGGAICKVSATWKRNGKDDKIEGEIAVKVNEFMGIDGIVGKAERKLYKRVLDRLTGVDTPEGDPGDDETRFQNAKTANVSTSAPPSPPPPPINQAPPASAPASPAPAAAPANPPATAPAASTAAAMPPGNGDGGDSGEIQNKLGDFMVSHGINWDIFSNYGVQAKWQQPWESLDGFNMLSKEFAEMIWKSRNAIGAQIQRWKADKGL